MSLKESTSGLFERASMWATEWSGRSQAVLLAVLTVLIWGASGPFFHFSDSWQLVINSVTSIATFLMVFLIQRAQNKSSMAVQLKLNEIIGALGGASNRMIGIEEMSEDQLRNLHGRYQQLAEITQNAARLKAVVSVETLEDHVSGAPSTRRP